MQDHKENRKKKQKTKKQKKQKKKKNKRGIVCAKVANTEARSKLGRHVHF